MIGRCRRRPDAARPAFVLVAVIVILAVALLIVGGMVSRSSAERGAIIGTANRAEARAAAVAGLRVIAEELADGRDAVLAGGDPPEPAIETELFESGADVWVVRVLPVAADGSRMSPEAARVDLGLVTAADLESDGLIAPEVAAAIVRGRGNARIGTGPRTVAALAGVDGVDPEVILGPLDEIRTRDEASGAEADVGDRILARLAAGDGEALVDRLTRHAVEPAVQRDGRRRIVLRGTWSEELGERLDERFGDGTGAAVRGLMQDEGVAFESDAEIVRQLIRFDIELEGWSEFLDVLTGDPAEEHVGRLDVNRADASALASLPGIDAATAEEIVEARDGLADDVLESRAWLVSEGLVEPEAFVEIVDRVTTRSVTWRVRIATGRRPLGDAADAPLRDLTILEAVIDLAAPRPRIAELVDITHRQLAAELVFDRLDWDETGGADAAIEFGGENVDGVDDGDVTGGADDDGRFDFSGFGDFEGFSGFPGFGDDGLVSEPEPGASRSAPAERASPRAADDSGTGSPGDPRRPNRRWGGG